MCVPPTVLALTTMTILWVNSHSPERKSNELWLNKLEQRGPEFKESGTCAMCHNVSVGIECHPKRQRLHCGHMSNLNESKFDPQLENKHALCFFPYLDISSSSPGTLWPLRAQDRDFQKAMGTGGPVVCGSPDHAWTNRFYQTESRGSTRSTRPPHSALNWERDLRVRIFPYFMFTWILVWNRVTFSSLSFAILYRGTKSDRGPHQHQDLVRFGQMDCFHPGLLVD